jgi:hypothetical protein
MINLREHTLSEAKSRAERFRIKVFGTKLPADYLCRNLQDFLINREKIGAGRIVLLPKLFYFPHSEDKNSLSLRYLCLQDDTGRIEAVARPTALNPAKGESLDQSINELWGGDALFFPTLRNCMLVPYSEPDPRIYLDSFTSIKQPGKNRSILSKLRDSLPDFNLPELAPESAR